MENNMKATIEPKSEQLNADSLLAGPRTITIREVQIAPGTEQPVAVFFDGDDGRPYLPCKSMRRVMVAIWGPDAGQYSGRSLTLYRDPAVTWGGMEVGGIRISHMSHLDRRTVVVLTATKKARKPFTVDPLVIAVPTEPVSTAPRKPSVTEWIAALKADLGAAQTTEAVEGIAARESVQKALGALNAERVAEINAAISAALKRVAPAEEEIPFGDEAAA